jgi:hypothetical protein
MFRRFIFLIASCMLLLGCSKEMPPLPVEVDNDGGFRLKDISLAEAIERQPRLDNCGGREYIVERREYLDDTTAVKYPQFKGSKPLYGFARFGRNFLNADKEIKYFFALDASGADGYDMLYFDVNHDQDLTNDPPLGLSKNPWPAGLKPWLAPEDRLVFEELAIPIDFGPDYGVRPVKFLPVSWKPNVRGMHFVSLSFHAGRIKIAQRQFDVIFGQEMVGASARLDGHVFRLYMMEPGEKRMYEDWFPGDELDPFRLIDDKYYTFSAAPMGDKLFVKPYTGELGTLKIGMGSRNIKNFSAAGSLTSQTSAVQIGKTAPGNQGVLLSVAEWQLPVGDYVPYFLTLHYDALTIEIRCNSHSDGKLFNDRGRPRMFPIQIRKDKPFVLDLANKPEFYFPRSEKNMVYKPGKEVNLEAVLIDPVLGILFRDISENNKSLDPAVTIRDSRGKIVSEGPMPFC